VMMRLKAALASQSPRTIFLFCFQMTFLAQIGQLADLGSSLLLVPQNFRHILAIYPTGPPIWQGQSRSSRLYLEAA